MTLNRIYKYELGIADEQDITIDGGIKVLTITKQYGRSVLYALVDVDKIKTAKLRVDIMCRGTGHDVDFIPDNDLETKYKYIATLSFREDALMFHYFTKETKIEISSLEEIIDK